jgi:predicted nucleotidyltransferase
MFNVISDIDIAFEGLLDRLAGLKIQDAAESMTDFPVDIVELERVHPAIAEDIKQHGRLRYERK